ncbi:YiaA/YiaB family inner membrane protein [Pseudonocardia acaciae]|uniref:YiaA/YiaB family inner membrane protein n=1 Tax=Pseudonocardia acaciae TaxID=551276 RepID=UPI00048C51A4|nr:YiaA/YiaB family inner membrane protein [Pseudonocardia acaciae]
MTNSQAPGTPSGAFHVQAIVSFAISLGAVIVAIAYLPDSGWVRAFLALGVLYLTTSAFTLAKCIRDKQETLSVTSRIDQARLERLLAEHDPFRSSGS